MHFALYLAIARAEYARLGRAPEEAVVVTLRLRRKEASDTHGYRAGDELGNAAQNDELGLAEGRQARGEREGHRETVRETDDTVSSGPDRSAPIS